MFDAPAPTRTLRVLLGGLIFVLGAQSLRFFFGSIAWYLRDTLGVPVLDLIPFAVAPVVAGLLLPVLSRWLTVRGALWIGVLLLVVSRILNQVSSDAGIEHWSSTLAVAAFTGLLPLMLSIGRSALVGGLIMGLAIDSAIKGMGLSLDLAHQDGAAPMIMVIALCLILGFVMYLTPHVERQGVPWGSGWTLLGLGPMLFVEYLILQNQGWTSEVTGISGPQAQLRIALLNVLALVALAWLEKSRAAVLAALLILVSAAALAEGSPFAFNVLSLIAVPSAALVWSAMVPDPDERGVSAGSVYLVGGMLLFAGIGLLYYIPLDLDLGYTQSQMRLAGTALLALFGFAGVVSMSAIRPGASRQSWAFAALASILPLLGFLLGGEDSPSVAVDDSIRVMTYNIHSAYNTEGRLQIDEIARVIGDSGADVIALQEVPRGRLMSGVTDELTLLQARLGFEHIAFFGTTDPTWGNAIISKFPITAVGKDLLPLVDTPMQRGYLGATIRIGERSVVVASTHLQHINDSAVHDEDPEADLYPVHRRQIQVILQAWGGAEPAVLMGDFNARPDWLQIEELLSAGWVDAWSEAGTGDGFTSNAIDPRYRIDYVFVTPDIEVLDAGVIQSQASDHFPVVVDLSLP